MYGAPLSIRNAKVPLGVILDVLARDHQVETTLIAIVLLPLAAHSRWRYVELAAAAFLAAVASMVKFNLGIQGVSLVVAVLAAVVYRDWPLTATTRRQAMAVPAVLLLSICGLYTLSTGSVPSLWPYLRTGWDIVSGYSDAVTFAGPLSQASLDFALCVLVFAGLPWLALDRHPLWIGYAPAALSAYVALKHALVRQDQGHAASFCIHLAVAMLFLLVCSRAVRDRRLILLLQGFCAVMAYASTVEAYPAFRNMIVGRVTMRPPYTLYFDAYRHWPATWQSVGRANEQARAAMRVDPRFSQAVGRGTVTAIPWNIDCIKAQNWKWRPAPVLQFYSAYTPLLDGINADHLASDSAADFAVVDFDDIDSQHPFLSEPLSWRALLDRYDLEVSGDNALLVKRRREARFLPAEAAGEETVGWDQEVVVPQTDGLLLAAPHVKKSLAGRLISFAYRCAPVYVDAVFTSGKTVRWRTVSANLASGVLIRPFPQNRQDLQSLFLMAPSQAAPDRLRAIRFHTENPSQYQSKIPLAWSRLPLKATEVVAVPYPLPAAALVRLWTPKDPAPQPHAARVVPGRFAIEAIPAAEDSQLKFHLGPNLGRYRALVIRARFQKTDSIDAFFGKEIDGRGVNGIIPAANQWFDVYLNMAQNPFWDTEHGMDLRFDPVTVAGPGTTAEIAGIWGTTVAVKHRPDIEFYPVPEAEWPGKRAK